MNGRSAQEEAPPRPPQPQPWRPGRAVPQPPGGARPKHPKLALGVSQASSSRPPSFPHRYRPLSSPSIPLAPRKFVDFLCHSVARSKTRSHLYSDQSSPGDDRKLATNFSVTWHDGVSEETPFFGIRRCYATRTSYHVREDIASDCDRL